MGAQSSRLVINTELGQVQLAQHVCLSVPLLVFSILYLGFGWGALSFCGSGYLAAILGIAGPSCILSIHQKGFIVANDFKMLVDGKNLFISTAFFAWVGLILHITSIALTARYLDYFQSTFTYYYSSLRFFLVFDIIGMVLMLLVAIFATVGACKLASQIEDIANAGAPIPECCACATGPPMLPQGIAIPPAQSAIAQKV